MKLFVPIRKVDEAQRLVYGVIANETPDKSGEVFDYKSSAPHFKAWSANFEKATDGKSLGNVRAMHGKVAAGKLTDIAFDDAAAEISVCAKVIDDAEWKKVAEGVYTGFSIGGSYVKTWADPETPTLKRYEAMPSEVSIVDNPCMNGATFSMVKADGMAEDRAFKAPEPEPAPNAPAVDLEQVWKAKDGSTFKLKADALAHNETLGKVAPVVEPVEKTARVVVVPLAKGMYDVSRFADLLGSIRYLVENAEYEAATEGDGSTVPDDLRAWLVEGARIFIASATEEARELVGATDDDLTFDLVLEMAAKAEGLAKASKSSHQVIHDHAVKLGAKCASAAKAVEGGDLAKMTTDLAASSDALAKATDNLAKVTAERDEAKEQIVTLIKAIPVKYATEGKPLVQAIEKMDARITELEAQPTKGGPLGHVAVSKGMDAGGTEQPSEADVAAALAKMTPEQQTMALMKAAQRNPIRV